MVKKQHGHQLICFIFLYMCFIMLHDMDLSCINKPTFLSIFSIFFFILKILTMTEIITIKNPVDLSGHFRRKSRKEPKIICKYCSHEIDLNPRNGINRRRDDHLNGCEKYHATKANITI